MKRQRAPKTWILAAWVALALGLSGCLNGNGDTFGRSGPQSQRAKRTPVAGIPERPGAIPANAAISQLNPDWTFIGVEALEHVFRQEFKITGTNRDPAAEAEVLTALDGRRMDLGGNNYAMGMSESLGPEPSKFRSLVEISTSACNLAVRDPLVRQKFFPEVSSSSDLTALGTVYDVAFLRLLGRYPEPTEKGILGRMVTDLRAQGSTLEGQLLGVCAVILNTLEFTHGR